MNFLGIDLGTSSVKIIIMNKEGRIVEILSKEYLVYYPKSGWAEQETTDWWNATLDGIKELVLKSEVDGNSNKGIGFSGQMHGLVMLDKEGNSLRPALLWCDQRTQEECDYLNNEIGREKISKYTGNMALTGFTAPKVLWVKKHERELFEKTAHMLLPKDYIRYKLTGEFATDVSDASGTLMFDVENRTWSKEMIEILGIEEKVLPKIYESWEVTGELSKEVADYTGLSVDTLVVGGAGAVGTGTIYSGIVSVTLGTSGVVFASSDNYSVDDNNRLHSFCHGNGKFHQMGVVLSAASSLKWWVDNVNKDVNFDGYDDLFLKLIDEAEKSEVGGKGLLLLTYLMGERTPHSDPNARGTFIGTGMTHERGDMTRAILEGVCFGLRDSLEILKDLNVPIDAVRVSGGGAKSKLWKQILADVDCIILLMKLVKL